MPETNTARDAAMYEVRVQAGDVVVLGTDGLFDNLSDRLVAELTEVLSLGGGAVSLDAVQATADGLATQARAMAQSKTAVTPWSR
jgi:serine/threonine protein phosphatase PrpC